MLKTDRSKEKQSHRIVFVIPSVLFALVLLLMGNLSVKAEVIRQDWIVGEEATHKMEGISSEVHNLIMKEMSGQTWDWSLRYVFQADDIPSTASEANGWRLSDAEQAVLSKVVESVEEDVKVYAKYGDYSAGAGSPITLLIYAREPMSQETADGEMTVFSQESGKVYVYAAANPPAGVDKEKEVDYRVKSIMDGLNIGEKSEYEKAKAVFDYVVNHVLFDNAKANINYQKDEKNQGNYGKTGYEALFQGKAISEGFARLTARMMNEAGLLCKYVEDDTGGHHAWNILRVDGLFYNVDTVDGKFLLSNAAITDNHHVRGAKYNTDQFNAAYKMDENNYGEAKLVGTLGLKGTEDYGKAFEQLAYINDIRKKLGYQPLVMDEEWASHAMTRAAECVIHRDRSVRPDGRGESVPRKNISNGAYQYSYRCGMHEDLFYKGFTVAGIGAFKRTDGEYSFYYIVGNPADYRPITSKQNVEKSLVMNVKDQKYDMELKGYVNGEPMKGNTVNVDDKVSFKVESPAYKNEIYLLVPQNGIPVFQTITEQAPAYVWDSAAYQWSSSQTKVATVSKKGALTFQAGGETTIKAGFGGLELSCDLTVTSDGQSVGDMIQTGTATYRVVSYKRGKNKGTVSFVSYYNRYAESVKIPASVKYQGKTYTVVEIEAKAFYKLDTLKKVTIGKNVKTIGKNAFRGCKRLKSIVVKGTKITKVKSNVLKGIHSKCKISVPKSKLKAYKKLFKGKGQKKTVKVVKA